MQHLAAKIGETLGMINHVLESDSFQKNDITFEYLMFLTSTITDDLEEVEKYILEKREEFKNV